MTEKTDGPRLLTNSRLRAYRDCARLHHLKYELAWRPLVDSEALRFGSLIHLGLEAWWKAPTGARWTAALAAVEGRAIDGFEAVRAEELLIGYHRRWEPEAEKYEVLAVEESFAAPLLNPETSKPSRTWLLAGKVDVVVREFATGRVLLVEHKTTSEEFADGGSTYWAKLHMDTQVSHYVIGAERLGHPIDGILYDVLRRPQQRPKKATPVESRKYRKKDGALYAGQRETDETESEYRERVREDIRENPDRYFGRDPVARTDSDLLDYLHDAWGYGKQIREAERAGRAPKNPDACHRFGECAFWQVCAFGLRPEDHPDRFEKLDDVNPELEVKP